MRNGFNTVMLKLTANPDFCFLTGDLGFQAFEPLEAALGDRFINMGIAEQNMISVAAAMASSGLKPWVYSIAPFCYARPFEQIRNDICFHNLPVRLIGNGGGFGYGVQGPSHHAIEDCGVMSALQNMTAFAPVFLNDVNDIVALLEHDPSPAYMRLGRDEAPADYNRPAYAPIRKLCDGSKGIILAFGTVAGMALSNALKIDVRERPAIWACSQLPLLDMHISDELLEDIKNSEFTLLVEEHVATGGFGSAFALHMMKKNIPVKNFMHKCVKGYVSGLYGSQNFHRIENEIDSNSIWQTIHEAGF